MLVAVVPIAVLVLTAAAVLVAAAVQMVAAVLAAAVLAAAVLAAAVLAAAVLSVVLLAAVCSAMIRSMASQSISSPSESMSGARCTPRGQMQRGAEGQAQALTDPGGEKGKHFSSQVLSFALSPSQKGVPREPHLVERGSRPGLNAALAWSAGALIMPAQLLIDVDDDVGHNVCDVALDKRLALVVEEDFHSA